MPDLAIRAENLGKKYVIRHQQQGRRYKALRDVLADKFKTLLSLSGQDCENPTKEEFWALRDVSFEVKHGESIGIVGCNGAGKSTLLKVLSRVTEPSRGRFELRGRVASLLEVGTGFHPELTGRENIFLNASILGMSRAETRMRFDEIVDFAQIERFLDTPVKRYSSGMYTRLAFAIAAHLEPEILIIDEVLAVGDVNFQKKCITKISDAATKGSTVLFVSHNMDLVTKVCNLGLLIERGVAGELKPISNVVEDYIQSAKGSGAAFAAASDERPLRAAALDEQALLNGQFKLKIHFRYPQKPAIRNLGFVVYTETDHPIFGSNTIFHPPCEGDESILEGEATVIVDAFPLWSGLYKVSIWVNDTHDIVDFEQHAITFDYIARDTPLNAPSPRANGPVHLPARWVIRK